MSTERLPVRVLLAGALLPFAYDMLNDSVELLDGREPEKRSRLIADHRDSIRAIATNAHDGASRALIESLPRLEIIACFSAGMDYIDIEAAKERGVVVTNTSAALVDDVADVAIAHCLLLFRRFNQADRYVRDGGWLKQPFPLMRSLKGARLGILGMGAIGDAIARRATVMSMTVAYNNRRPRDVPYRYVADLRDLARESDILVVCCPATEETRGLVDARVLEALGPEGYVVNIARGSVIDEPALVAALQAGTIAGAGLDVFADEPNVPPALLAMENVSLSPHVGSGTLQTRTAMARSMIDSLRAHFGG